MESQDNKHVMIHQTTATRKWYNLRCEKPERPPLVELLIELARPPGHLCRLVRLVAEQNVSRVLGNGWSDQILLLLLILLVVARFFPWCFE